MKMKKKISFKIRMPYLATIWGRENQENKRFFDKYRKFPVAITFSDTQRHTLYTGIGLNINENVEIPEVTVDPLNPPKNYHL